MNSHPTRSFLSPVLIGRASQMERLRRLITGDGTPQTVIISGEAGIGKSRLAVEARAIAESAGYRVAAASCFERDAALPYSLVIDLLRQEVLNRAPDETTGLLRDLGGELIKLVPELVLRYPGLEPSSPLDAEQEKRRIFQALIELLLRLSEGQPLLVIFEDLHWADDTTLEFLAPLCRQVSALRAPGRVRLLLTYRTEDARPPLRHLLADLDRMRLVTELPLGTLTRAETDVMVAAILGLRRPLRRESSEHLFTLTEGNPFFVEEILKSLHTDEDADEDAGDIDRRALDSLTVPRSLEHAVTRRSNQLSAQSGRLLETAAVAGQRFELPLLQAVTGLGNAALIEQVKELIAAQLVIEEGPQRFRFRHALTREAVYAQLLSTERREHHRTLAEAIEALNESRPDERDARLADLAHHFYEAGEWAKARDYCEQAGRRAHDLFAPAACVQHLSQAIEAARNLGAPATPSILRLRASSYETLGEFDLALGDLEAALDGARKQNDEWEQWEALNALGVLWLSRDYGRAGDYLQAALALARKTGERRLLAHSLNRVGNWEMNTGDPPAALALHQEALTIFRELGDTEGTAATLDLLGMTSFHSVKLEDQLNYHREAVRLFRKLGNRQGAVSGLSVLAVNATSYDWALQAATEARFAEAMGSGEEALREAREIGWRAGEAFACSTLALASGARGQYERALPYADECLSIAEEIQHTQWHVAGLRVKGEIYIDILAPELARTILDTALPLATDMKSDFWTASVSAALSRALIQLGDLDRAAAVLAPFDPEGPLVATSWMTGGAHAQVALAAGRPEKALELAVLLEQSAWPDRRPSRLALIRIEALLALGRLDEAEAALEAMLAGAPGYLPAPLYWRALVLRGRVLTSQGRRSRAREAFVAAQSAIEETAQRIEDPVLRSQFLAGASRSLPRSRPAATARRQAKQEFQGLTEREREVAALIAHGPSNREIAAALYLSERTVAVHIANILAKLDFSSRAQIASWATANGLADTASPPGIPSR